MNSPAIPALPSEDDHIGNIFCYVPGCLHWLESCALGLGIVSLLLFCQLQTFDWKMFVQNFRSLAFNGKWIVSFCCQIDTVLNHLGEGNVIEKLSIFFGRVLLIANLCEGDKSG